MTLRILMVNKFHYLRGGSETYYFAVGESLAQMGHNVAWFSMQDPQNLPCDQAEYFVSNSNYTGKTSAVHKLKDGLSLVYSFEARKKFEKLLEDFRPDVIHLNLVHRQLTFSILDAPYLKKHAVPVVYTAHDYILICPNYTMLDGSDAVCEACLDGHFCHCIARRCVKKSRAKSMLAAAEAAFLRAHGSYHKIDRIIAPSEFMHAELLAGGFDDSRIVTMQNFVTDEALSQACKDTDDTHHANPYLIFFGRLSHEKGIEVLLDAFLSIAHLIPRWRLFIVGAGPEQKAVASKLAGQSERVVLTGFQQGTALEKLVRGASLAVCPSRWRENMPYSIVEAFAAGTPVIGTRIGGIPELISEGSTGFLAEPDNASSLAQAILRGVTLCNNRNAYRSMQAQCRAFVLEHCNQATYMKRLVSLYQALIDEKKETH